MKDSHRLFCLLLAGFLLAGCTKKTDTPAAASAAVSSAAPIPVSSSATSEEDPALVAKREAMNFALMEESIKSDPKGQWAISAKASSTYATDVTNTAADYHAFRATGAPDTQFYSDAGTSWATKETDSGIEWIELSYEKPVSATQVKIRQNYNPGAIIKVELFDEAGTAHSVWQGPDATTYPHEITWLNLSFDKTAFKTQRVKITLATNAVPGWNEIDAVQLIGD